MPTIEALILCRYAEVNGGLITVVGGGITRVFAPGMPVKVHPLYLAVVLVVPAEDVGKVVEFRMCAKRVDQAEKLSEVVGALRTEQPHTAMPGEGIHCPLVLNLSEIEFPTYGQFDLQTFVDGASGPDLSFWITQTPPA